MSKVLVSYGQALYDLAREAQLEDAILQEMTTLECAFAAEPSFLDLLCAPNISKDERCDVVTKVLGDRVHPYVENTVKLLTRKGLVKHFTLCSREYQRLYDAAHGILPVRAVTAVPLSREQSLRLEEKLKQVTGKTIRLENRVDPGCMGGVCLDYDGKQLDGSVKNRLASVRELLKNTVL